MSVRSALGRPVPAAAATTVVLLPVVLTIVLVWTTGPSPQPIDYSWFGPGGEAVLTGRWGSVFGDPAVQAGPFELLPFGVAHLLGITGTAAWTAVLGAFAAVSVFLTALALRPTMASDLRSSVLAAGGALVVSAAGATQTWVLGHPSDALVPLVWVVAARLALRDRPGAAAVLVAASSGFEVWGLLGAPVVLLAADVRIVRSAGAGALTLALLWVPFVLAGPFEMFSFSWEIVSRSLIHRLQPEATAFPWSFRMAQALLSVSAGTVVALLLRGRNAAWGQWAVVVAVVAGRMVLDPVLAGYYWCPALIGAIGALVLAAHRADLVAAASAAVAFLLTANVGSPWIRALVLVGWCVLAAAGARWRTARGRTPRRLVIREGRLILT